jgi:hypothetical protein
MYPAEVLFIMRTSTARASRFLGSSVVLLALLGASGCGAAGQMTREVAPAAIDSGLRAMDDPANKDRMAHMVGSPQVKNVEAELIAGVLDGSLAALGDEERIARVNSISARYAKGMFQTFSKEVAPQIGPMIGPMVADVTRNAVQSAMSAAMNPATQREMSTAISTAMTHDLGPAIQKVLSDNLAPGIAAALQNEEVKRALGDTAHLLGREMVLGVNEGMMKAQEQRGKGESSMLGSLGNLASKGASIATAVTWVLAALVLVLGGLLIKLLMQARKYRSESEEKQAETRLMTEARLASEGKPWSGELIAALENRFHATDRAAPSRRSDVDHPSHPGH